MKARDVMSANVITVSPETPVDRIAARLLEHGISAVPVVEAGIPIGLISETDLVARSADDTAGRQSWCLRSLAGGQGRQPSNNAFGRGRLARDVMSAPVVTTGEDAELAEVVSLMVDHSIKRVPVVRAGKIIGILSRADMLRALSQGLARASDLTQHSHLSKLFSGIDKAFDKKRDLKPPEVAGMAARPNAVLSAADFQTSALRFHERERQSDAELRRRSEAHHAHEIEVALGTHITEDAWRRLLIDARLAAEHGETEYLLLRVPRETCSDGGRAINVGEPDWPTTLRGEAAELWLRYKHDLEREGFRMHARVLDYTGGVPGDIGLFLVWGR